MPFGLDPKSIIVGILLAWFVIPWIQGLLARGRGTATTT